MYTSRLVTRFLEVEEFRRKFQYDRFAESVGVEAVLTILRAAARLVCDAVERELTDVLLDLKPALGKMSPIFLALAGDVAFASEADEHHTKLIFERGTSFTVYDVKLISLLPKLTVDVAVAAIYLWPLNNTEDLSSIEWQNTKAPGLALVQNERNDAQRILLALLLLPLVSSTDGRIRSRCFSGIKFLFRRFAPSLQLDDIRDTLTILSCVHDHRNDDDNDKGDDDEQTYSVLETIATAQDTYPQSLSATFCQNLLRTLLLRGGDGPKSEAPFRILMTLVDTVEDTERKQSAARGILHVFVSSIHGLPLTVVASVTQMISKVRLHLSLRFSTLGCSLLRSLNPISFSSPLGNVFIIVVVVLAIV